MTAALSSVNYRCHIRNQPPVSENRYGFTVLHLIEHGAKIRQDVRSFHFPHYGYYSNLVIVNHRIMYPGWPDNIASLTPPRCATSFPALSQEMTF